MSSVLIVDDDPEFRAIVEELLTKIGFTSCQVSSGAKAVALLSQEVFDIVLLDLVFPGMDGLETLREIRRINEKVKVILVSAYVTVENAVEGIKLGASDVLTKPFRLDEFTILMHRTMQEVRFERKMMDQDLGPGLDLVLKCFSNPIRREIVQHLSNHATMRLSDLLRKLSITDHTKLTFHLKNLLEHDIISKSPDRAYSITPRGRMLLSYLMNISFKLESRSP
ncbi:MAG: response regulator [Magnetococcus sp. DMHC-6]